MNQQKEVKFHFEKNQIITFKEFKQYCQKVVPLLNDFTILQKQNYLRSESNQRMLISYYASYKVQKRKFAKQHDCQYLEIQCQFLNEQEQKILLKINITYSLAYQIPLLLFMPYHICQFQDESQNGEVNKDTKKQKEDTKNSLLSGESQPKPFRKEEVHKILNLQLASENLRPQKQQTGVFIVQNHINQQYFYSLHHCQINNQQMKVNQLIPFYLAILGCHPELVL